jgi:hypothetical protein
LGQLSDTVADTAVHLPPAAEPLPGSKAGVADRYRSLPRWARIAAPITVGLIAIGAATGGTGDDDKRDVSTDRTTAPDDAMDQAVELALEKVSFTVPAESMRNLILDLCDADVPLASRDAVDITGEPERLQPLVDGAGTGAEHFCPEVAGSSPALLNDVVAAATVLAAPTTAEPTTTAVASVTTEATTAATQAPVTTKAAPVTQPPVTAPPATAPPSQQCHPNYSGCLDPDASDYDCAGGSGNGPKYTGTVTVYGADPFDLDSDNDGTGCE